MNHEKTFAAIEKLKDVELELHRLKNALEMANRALDAQRPWVGLTETFKIEQTRINFQAALHNAVFWQNKCVDLYEIIELFCLDAQAAPQQQEPRNFCPRCGKRTADLTVIHTCTPPEGGHQ